MTSGLSALIDFRADSTLRSPTRSVVWTIWRWRLLTVDDVEVDDADGPDAGGREVQAAGEPRPPAPMSSAFEPSSLAWPSEPTSGMSRWRL